jgi:glycosyltransferase involved in cell wall biosynthesis
MHDFAVVIPTYRRSAYLAEAVDSVLAQTHPPAEVIVVCDGPTSLPRGIERGAVRVVEQAHNGAAAARNTGIRESTAPWLCFLDDDDLWHPDRLRLAAGYLGGHAQCRALTTASWWFSSEATDGIDFVATDLASCVASATLAEPVTDMAYLDIDGRSFDLLLERNRSNISGSTIRRDVLEQAGGFPDGYTCAEDWLMAINVARYTEWCYLDKRLSFVRKHAGNNTATNPTNGLVTLRAISEAWADRSRPVPAHRALAEYGSVYRWTIQGAVWNSIRRRQVGLAIRTLRQGLPLLPRLKDRAYVFVPPPISWRIEHATQRRRASSRGNRDV